MNSCNLLCQAFSNIHWMWYVISVIVTFGVGALWYSVFFSKTWIRVFKVEMPEKISKGSFIRTMLMQFVVNALLGLTFFVLTGISAWLAILVLIAVCGWQKGQLNFQFAKWKDFVMAAIINAGYTFVIGIIFILFALI